MDRFILRNLYFLSFSLANEGNQKIHALSKCGWIKELHDNLRNFGFRNSFFLYKNCNFVLKFLRGFIVMDFSPELTSRQHPRHSTIWSCHIPLLYYIVRYVKLWQVFFHTEKNKYSFIFIKINWHFFVNTLSAQICKFLV